MNAAVQPLLARWNEVAARLASRRTIALFLDFDGTLVALRPRPELVQVHPGVRRTLAALSRSPRFLVWVISARRRADIRARVHLPEVRYLGLYGWERGTAAPPPPGPIACVKRMLAASLPVHPEVWIEDKQYTIAVHYRGAPDAVGRIAVERLKRATEPWRGCLRIAAGKYVREVVPRGLGDKGSAVRRELARLTGSALPVYLGDDSSDEAAFAALPPSGISIHVGGTDRTRARYRLKGPSQVYRFLEKLRSELL